MVSGEAASKRVTWQKLDSSKQTPNNALRKLRTTATLREPDGQHSASDSGISRSVTTPAIREKHIEYGSIAHVFVADVNGAWYREATLRVIRRPLCRTGLG